MQRLFFVVFAYVLATTAYAQQYSMSFGIYTGITIPYTYDEGISEDSRYKTYYNVKFAPIGINYSMDYEKVGFLISPGLIEIGQDFYVTNTLGGDEGIRRIDMKYINVPVGIKLHIIDLSFFKLSGVATISTAFLLDAEEKIRHNDAKFNFPEQVYPIIPETYSIEYDGVISPRVDNYEMLKKEDFNKTQFFAGAGFRADWDVNADWRVSFDFRVNYGLLEPRSNEYIARLNAFQTLYDIPGNRRDMFAQFSVGIAKYVDFDKGDRDRQKKLKGSSKPYIPKRAPKKVRPKG